MAPPAQTHPRVTFDGVLNRLQVVPAAYVMFLREEQI
jgi:hypothetical protein